MSFPSISLNIGLNHVEKFRIKVADLTGVYYFKYTNFVSTAIFKKNCDVNLSVAISRRVTLDVVS
jgi:hypothetical protein